MLNAHEIHIYFFNADAYKDPVDGLIRYLSVDERCRADKFRVDEGRRTYVIARAMLRRILGACLDQDPRELAFSYAEHGKPFLASQRHDSAQAQFNISHSHGGIVIGIARDMEIGVDIEKIQGRASYRDIAKRFFAKEEWGAFQELPEHAQGEAFLRIWTRKEAFIKACGQGLSYPLKDFFVPARALPPEKPYAISGNGCGLDEWFLYDLEAPQGFIGACAAKARGNTEIKIINHLQGL